MQDVKLNRVEAEYSLSWIRNYPELFRDAVTAFIREHKGKGARIHVNKDDDHRVVVSAEYTT